MSMKKSIGARTLLCVHPDLIICTYDREGRANAMAAAWGGICSSRPPSVAVSVQSSRYTYQNLLDQREFTLNIPSVDHIAEADYFGIDSGRETDKFEATGLTPVKAEHVNAPYIAEFPMFLECRLEKTVEIGVHTQFIGEILDVKVDEDALGEDGKPAIHKIRPFFYDAASVAYYGIGEKLGPAFSLGKGFRRR
jgi:flavin reductase (DIM6/NTAB) family NADH-FMN oxidoreductase RutF